MVNRVDFKRNVGNLNDYFLANIGFDTAKNEHSKVCYKSLTPHTYDAWIP